LLDIDRFNRARGGNIFQTAGFAIVLDRLSFAFRGQSENVRAHIDANTATDTKGLVY